MYKILLDEEFYKNINSNKQYFDNLLSFLLEYTNFRFITFHPFLYNTNSPQGAYAKTLVEQKILKNRRLDKYDYNIVLPIKDKDFDILCFTDKFIGEIYFIHSNLPDVKLIIPLVDSKHSHNIKKCKDYIYYINHFSKELDSNIRKWIKEDVIHIDIPTKEVIFPSKEFCNGYETLRSDILKSFNNNTKRAKFMDIGFEVAERNRYIYNDRLSSINSQYRGNTRKIFINTQKIQIYLSVDFENGGFEVFDKNGKHKGQYRFNGEFDKDASPIDHYIVFKI